MRKQAKRKIALGAAAVLAASMTFGSIFAFCVTAEEETVKAADLFTVSEGVTVTPATTAKNSAGEEIGNPGLYFKAPEGESEFTVNINGVFTHSAGFRWNVIGDLWAKNLYKETIFTVSEANNPENGFELHFAGQYQSAGWIEYEWNGTTIYRGMSKNLLPDNIPVPGEENINYNKWTTPGYWYTEEEVKDIEKSQPRPTMAHNDYDRVNYLNFGYVRKNSYVQDSKYTWDGDAFKESEAFAIGGATSDANMRNWMLAYFSESPETYEPIQVSNSEYEGVYPAECNLPKITFENGYTISVTVIGGGEGDSAYCPDLLIGEVGEIESSLRTSTDAVFNSKLKSFEAEDEKGEKKTWNPSTGDNYTQPGYTPQGCGCDSAIYSLAEENVKFVTYSDGSKGGYTDVPMFYQRWKETVFKPEIAVPETLPDVFVGETTDIPEATYTSFKQLKPVPVTDVKVTPPEGEVYAAGETLTVDKEGVYTITYTQDGYTKQVTFNALGQSYVRENRYQVRGASIRVSTDENGNGIRFAVVIKKDVYDSLKAAGAKFGTILIPNDMLEGDLTLDTKNIAKTYTDGTDGAQDIWTEVIIDDEVYMQSVVYLYNIPENNYLRKISVVGFIEMGGEVYYTEMQSRSIGQVAWKAYNTEPDAHYHDENLKPYFEGLSEEDKNEMKNLENKQ